jgi:hypothetical protein
MNLLNKILLTMASQIKKPNVKLRKGNTPHKITDDNQSIHHGVIHETTEFKPSLRSKIKG